MGPLSVHRTASGVGDCPTSTDSGPMSFVDSFADLLLGSVCPGCTRPGWGLCEACSGLLGQGPVRPDSTVLAALGVPVRAGGWYDPPLSSCIPAFKDSGAWHLAGVLAGVLVGAVCSIPGWRDAVLVPVPSRPDAVRSRGLDHTRTLSATVARRVGLRYRSVLRRTGSGPDQADLDRRARLSAPGGSMRAAPGVGPVIVIDDVITTGSTMAEAIRVLAASGRTPIGAASVAATPIRQGDGPGHRATLRNRSISS